MKVINYWEHFLTTGSVSDYLNYLGACRERESKEKAVFGETEGFESQAGPGQNEGAGKVEGTGQCYRVGIENGTHRGL